MVSSLAQTQQSQDFLASQAATQKLQEQLAQTQQNCDTAAADERAQEQAYKYVAVYYLACLFFCLAAVVSAAVVVAQAQRLLRFAPTRWQTKLCCRCCAMLGSPLPLMEADLALALIPGVFNLQGGKGMLAVGYK